MVGHPLSLGGAIDFEITGSKALTVLGEDETLSGTGGVIGS
jgi:hypothetical protein